MSNDNGIKSHVKEHPYVDLVILWVLALVLVAVFWPR